MNSNFRTFGWQVVLVVVSVAAIGSNAMYSHAQSPDVNESSTLAWPQFRGANGNPVAENKALPVTWSPTENIEWSVKLDGRGWSSPIVVGNRVFVTTAVSEGESKAPQVGTEYSNDYVRELSQQGLSKEEINKKVFERDFELPDQVSLKYFLICLNIEDGSELWRKQFHEGRPPGGRHRKNSFASETPTTDGKQVFVYIGNLGVFAFDLDGNPTWKLPMEANPIYMEFGTGSSPVMCDGRLIVLDDNEKASYIAAYDPKDGKQIWRTERKLPEATPAGLPRSGWTTPYVWRNRLRTEIVTLQPGTAISYDVDGNELWRMNGCSPAPAASSFAIGDVLYLNCGRGSSYCAIQPGASGEFQSNATGSATNSGASSDDQGDVKNEDAAQDDDSAKQGKDNDSLIVWRRPRAGTYIPTPVFYNDGLYIVHDNGIFQRLEADSGAQTFKERIKERGADFTTSPWAYNGKIFCLSEQGDTYVYEAGKDYKLLHVNFLGEFSMASPAIVGDRLLIRTEKALYSIRQKSP